MATSRDSGRVESPPWTSSTGASSSPTGLMTNMSSWSLTTVTIRTRRCKHPKHPINFSPILFEDSYFSFFCFFSFRFNLFNRYGQPTPPSYDLSLVREKVRLWHGSGDKVSNINDVIPLMVSLENAEVLERELPLWGHITFNIGLYNLKPYTELIEQLLADITAAERPTPNEN